MQQEENIEQLIIDHIDGKLSVADSEAIRQRINSSEKLKRLEEEYRQIFRAIDDDHTYRPSMKLRDDFQRTLANEASNAVSKISITSAKVVQIPLKTLYRVAAMLTLMLASYWYGNYSTRQSYQSSLMGLEAQQQQLKALAALSLFESESASKRIQGVAISMELEQPDLEVINALIHEMRYDKLVNVRLASARALEQFSDLDRVRDAFIEALKTEENDTMQIELIEILSHLKEKRAIPKMKEILQDESTPIFIKDQVETELRNLI